MENIASGRSSIRMRLIGHSGLTNKAMPARTKNFTFDKDTHTYRLRGNVIPSVTQVIGAVHPRNYECADWYLERGRKMHKAIHFLIQGVLDWSSVDEAIAGRLQAYQKFMTEYEGRAIQTETSMYSETYLFAGTTDAIITSQKKASLLDVLTDFKSSLEAQVFIKLG